MDNTKYYKVVTKDLCSAICKEIQYKIDGWVYPDIGKLFVFDSLANARNFIGSSDLKIFTCDVKNPKPGTKMVCGYNKLYDSFFWSTNNRAYSFGIIQTPTGTIFTDAVKLIKEVV